MSPDSDGYPTKEDLARIEAWPRDDPLGWFAFIRLCWWLPDWGRQAGWKENRMLGHDAPRYDLSTGGWSRNETIIAAMRRHAVLWTLTWQVHRRGGHYTFIVERQRKGKGESP